MEEKLIEEILDDLVPVFETLEAQNAAVLQFLKDKGVIGPDEFAGYLEAASNASNVRWRAARARINRLLVAAAKPPEETVEKKTAKSEEKAPTPLFESSKPEDEPKSTVDAQNRNENTEPKGRERPPSDANGDQEKERPENQNRKKTD